MKLKAYKKYLHQLIKQHWEIGEPEDACWWNNRKRIDMKDIVVVYLSLEEAYGQT